MAFAIPMSARTAMALAVPLNFPAFAQAPGGGVTLPATPEQRQAEPGAETPEATGDGLFERANLFGDLGGVRSRLEARGLNLTLSETSEVLGNPTGGRRRAVVYAGLTRLGLQVDTEKAFGLPGGTFKATAFQIHGRGLSLNGLGSNLHTVSNLEASNRGTLLGELWYEQAVLDGKLTVRAGQLLADQEFLTSQYAGLFINATFGWPTYTANTLPGGGPAYPFGALGVRVRAQPAENWTVLAGVFNGDPSGPDRVDGRPGNPSGTAFRLDDGTFAIAEAQYALAGGDEATGLPGTYKLGGWYHSGRFDDLRRDANGRLLADPLSDGRAVTRRGNWSAYAVADQLVWREAGTKDQGIGVFARIMGGPGDRNLLNFYADAGVTYKGLVPGRVDDTLGVAVAVARFSDGAAKADSDAVLAGSPRPVRRSETVLELTYQAAVAPWWQVQPVAQYVFRPSGEADPSRPERRLRDALVLGLRTNITF